MATTISNTDAARIARLMRQAAAMITANCRRPSEWDAARRLTLQAKRLERKLDAARGSKEGAR